MKTPTRYALSGERGKPAGQLRLGLVRVGGLKATEDVGSKIDFLSGKSGGPQGSGDGAQDSRARLDIPAAAVLATVVEEPVDRDMMTEDGGVEFAEVQEDPQQEHRRDTFARKEMQWPVARAGQDESLPRLISAMTGIKVVAIAAGGAHTLMLTSKLARRQRLIARTVMGRVRTESLQRAWSKWSKLIFLTDSEAPSSLSTATGVCFMCVCVSLCACVRACVRAA